MCFFNPNRRWNSQTLWRRSGSENIHLQNDEKNKEHLPGESDGSSSTPFQDSSLHYGEASNDFWSISGNYIIFTVITLNPESNCTYRLKHHSQSHWDTLTWPGPRVHRWVFCWRKVSTIVGTLMEIESCQMCGQGSHDSRHWMTNHWMDVHCLGGDWQENKRPPDSLWPEIWKDVSEVWKRREEQKWAIEKTGAWQC